MENRTELLECCVDCVVNLHKLKKLNIELYKELIDRYKIPENKNCKFIEVSGDVVTELGVPDDAIDFNQSTFNEDRLEKILTELIGNYPQYLVIANGVKWQGNPGYTFTNNILKTVERSYDVSIYLDKTNDNKAIKCIESTTDKPVGNSSRIIGLSYDEYNQVKDLDFDNIVKFGDSII